MYPTKEEAERLVKESEVLNPGPWGDHCRTAAHCAEEIAARSGMNAEKAYVIGLLHDIGRRFGKRHLGHVSDGYTYMMSLGYDEVAKISRSGANSPPTTKRKSTSTSETSTRPRRRPD